MLLPSKCPSWEDDYNPISDSLNDSSCISQVRVTGGDRGIGAVHRCLSRALFSCCLHVSDVPSERRFLVTLHTAVPDAAPRPPLTYHSLVPGIRLAH
jgi:hypothetical protein